MTEYDYSPDAYERYLATQQRIARWVDNTSRYRPSNPFVHSPTVDSQAEHDSPLPDSPSTSRVSRSSGSQYPKTRSRSSSDATHYKLEVPHSHKAPTSVQRNSAEYSPSPTSRHTSSSSRSRPTHHPRHASQSSSSRYTSRSNRTHATTTSYKTVTPNQDGPTYVKRSDTQPILVPIDSGRGGYVIVPPRGTRMEVLVSSCLLLLLLLAWWATSDVEIFFD